MARGLLNKTAVRQWCKALGLRITADALAEMEKGIEEILNDAKDYAVECDRTTIMHRDVKR